MSSMMWMFDDETSGMEAFPLGLQRKDADGEILMPDGMDERQDGIWIVGTAPHPDGGWKVMLGGIETEIRPGDLLDVDAVERDDAILLRSPRDVGTGVVNDRIELVKLPDVIVLIGEQDRIVIVLRFDEVLEVLTQEPDGMFT
jgi:hypothetical protein